MKTLTRILVLFSLFAAPMAYAAFEIHNGECHDKEKARVEGCKLCDTMSQELAD